MKMQIQLTLILFGCLLLAAAGCGSNAGNTNAVVPTSASNAIVPTQAAGSTAPTVAAQPTEAAAPTQAAELTTPASVAQPTKAAAPTLAPANPPVGSNDPRQVLANSLRAQAKVKSFRLKRTIIGADRTTLHSAEIILPDRLHTTDDKNETIVIAGIYYFKRGDQPWQKMPASVQSPLNALSYVADEKKIDAQLQTVSEFRLVGPEVLDGTPTLVYQFKTIIVQPPATGTSKIWIGVADNLPRKTESDSTSTINGQAYTGKITLLYSDYNADFKIEAPIQ
jgi:pyruvate/2-oxoglutarate dehydrogenase complex dihydrolipoamide acyltransferase (E2) component